MLFKNLEFRTFTSSPKQLNADPSSPLIEFSKLQLSRVTFLPPILTEMPEELTNLIFLITALEAFISNIWVRNLPSSVAPDDAPSIERVLFRTILESPEKVPLNRIVSFSLDWSIKFCMSLKSFPFEPSISSFVLISKLDVELRDNSEDCESWVRTHPLPALLHEFKSLAEPKSETEISLFPAIAVSS